MTSGATIGLTTGLGDTGKDATPLHGQQEILFELHQHLALQNGLCDALEMLADKLPANVDPQLCLSLANRLFPTIRRAHVFEEETLFPLLSGRMTACVAEDTLQRLHAEHWEDESFAEELTEVMREFAAGREANTDKLAYMLRGFFEGLRRHLAYEQDVVLPLLTAETLQ